MKHIWSMQLYESSFVFLLLNARTLCPYFRLELSLCSSFSLTITVWMPEVGLWIVAQVPIWFDSWIKLSNSQIKARFFVFNIIYLLHYACIFAGCMKNKILCIKSRHLYLYLELNSQQNWYKHKNLYKKGVCQCCLFSLHSVIFINQRN